MNPSENTNSILLSGKWKIESLEYNDAEKGWTAYQPYETCIRWEFMQELTMEFPDRSAAYSGKLREFFADGRQEETEYCCYTSGNELFIDRSYNSADGFSEVYINDRFRVECSCTGEYFLYDLEDVDDEPDGYRSKIRISRIKEN